MKKLSNTEGKLIGLCGLWGMIGIAVAPVLGAPLLTGTMAHIAFGVGLMQTVNILALKDDKGDKNND